MWTDLQCADSVYQALFSAYAKEPGDKASRSVAATKGVATFQLFVSIYKLIIIQ